MLVRQYALLLCWLVCPYSLWAQTPKKQMTYFDAQHHKLLAAKGASYAVETEFLDSVRAIEKWYFAPQKVREIAAFANIRRRTREGETVVYYDDGKIKRRMNYRAGAMLELSAYYPNGKLRRHYVYDKDSVTERHCFDENGASLTCDALTQQTTCADNAKSPAETSYVRYPAKALKLGMQGKVIVQFVVDRFGRVASIWVKESPSPLLNEEAIAAVRRIKKWPPKTIDCDPIDRLYTLPINFHIE